MLQFGEARQDLVYSISHKNGTVVDTTDPDGNRFIIRNDGSHTVELSEQYQQNQAKITKYGKVGITILLLILIKLLYLYISFQYWY